jgi:hypothetical protein
MRALSFWQPHALAIGIGLKPWETRGWSTDYRGPIAIHAAKRSWTDVGPWHSAARQILAEYVAKHGSVPWVFGAVVCTANLVSCIRTSELCGRIPAEHEFWGDFTDGEEGKGRYAFKLENVRMLAQPVFCRGMQGWFEVDLGAEERAAAAPLQVGLFEMFSTPPAPAAEAPKAEQMGLFFQEQACAPAVDVPADKVSPEAFESTGRCVLADPAATMWISTDVRERRAYYLYAARWWRQWAQEHGDGRSSESHRYAENQELLANDIERRPEYYQRKPANITDWNWYRADASALEVSR